MISFKEYLLEAFGDSAKHYKAIQTVERALDQATRPYQRMHDASWERYMGPKFCNYSRHASPRGTRAEGQFLKKAKELWLQGDLATYAVIWLLNFDQSTRPTTGPLSDKQLKMDQAVIAEPVNGEIIVVPSIRTPQPAFRYKFSGISTAVKQAIQSLKFFADNHHKAHYHD